MVETEPVAGQEKNRFVLWALIAVFALPVVCSWMLILHPGLLPARHSNHGVLIQPAVALPAMTVHRQDGSALRLEELRGKWTFLMAVDTCSEACRELVHQLQQIRRATGKDRAHVELVMLYRTGPAQDDLPVMMEAPGMIVAGFNDNGMESMATALQQAGVHERPGIIVIDPMGNMVMHYPQAAVTGKDILQDLRKLLRATRDWLPDMPEKPYGSV